MACQSSIPLYVTHPPTHGTGDLVNHFRPYTGSDLDRLAELCGLDKPTEEARRICAVRSLNDAADWYCVKLHHERPPDQRHFPDLEWALWIERCLLDAKQALSGSADRWSTAMDSDARSWLLDAYALGDPAQLDETEGDKPQEAMDPHIYEIDRLLHLIMPELRPAVTAQDSLAAVTERRDTTGPEVIKRILASLSLLHGLLGRLVTQERARAGILGAPNKAARDALLCNLARAYEVAFNRKVSVSNNTVDELTRRTAQKPNGTFALFGHEAARLLGEHFNKNKNNKCDAQHNLERNSDDQSKNAMVYTLDCNLVNKIVAELNSFNPGRIAAIWMRMKKEEKVRARIPSVLGEEIAARRGRRVMAKPRKWGT